MGLEALALAGLALSAAGAGAQAYSSGREAHKANEAAKDELSNQQRYQKQATQAFQQSLGQSTPVVQKQQQDIGADRLTQTIAKVNQAPLTVPSSVTGPSNFVTKDATASNTMANQSAAQFQGMNEWQLKQWIKDLRAQQQLGVISNLARGSASALPLEIRQALQSEEGTRLLGTGLSTTGGLLSSYSAAKTMPTKPSSFWLYDLNGNPRAY